MEKKITMDWLSTAGELPGAMLAFQSHCYCNAYRAHLLRTKGRLKRDLKGGLKGGDLKGGDLKGGLRWGLRGGLKAQGGA